MFRHPLLSSLLISAMLLGLSACGSSSNNNLNGNNGNQPRTTKLSCAVAREAKSGADLVSGPLARGLPGDLVIENNRLRAVIQKGGRNWLSIAQFGGNIIDAVPKNANGELAAEDHYEESALGTNLESSPNYQTVEVISAGGKDAEGNCQPAIIRATGPDDLLDFVNGSSAIRDMGFMFPDSADDVDLPIMVQTDYILEHDKSYVTINTTLINESADDLGIYMAEYMNGSGEVEMFQYGYGFGEPLLTAPCDSCRFGIYAGHEGGTGVSYGMLHDIPNSTSLSVSGVTVLVYGTDTLPLAAGGDQIEPPPFTVPGNGELLLTRWFAVGDGDVASIIDVKHEIFGEATGLVSGVVTDANGPVAGAEISVIAPAGDFKQLPVSVLDALGLPNPPAGPRGPATIVANQFRTDANGRYSGSLRPGDYELRLNVPGRGAGDPASASINVPANNAVVQNFTVPLSARLRVQVIDEKGQPVAAKVQLLGTDVSPDAGEPLNEESVFGLLTVNTGIFGDAKADPLAPGLVLAEFAVKDSDKKGAVTPGDTGVMEIEPGEYTLSVSRGPRYSEHVESITLEAGQLASVSARVVRVVDTPNYIFGDFHVHSFNSPDSEVTNRERVATYLAENMDFFTPSDHGIRVDFEPVIADMGVGHLIASTPSAEITTFDYGHFNAWPVGIDTLPANTDEPSQSPDPKTARGSVDWGRPAPAGQDFPSAGHYGLTPDEIYSASKQDPVTAGREVVMQINHVDSHFGAAGLEIDTGLTPPQSGKDPSTKRLPPNSGNLFSAGFDSLELWIGVDGRVHQFTHFLGENIGDWFNLLNQGILKTFVANSDTHERRLSSLSTRNMISVPGSLLQNGKAKPAALRNDPHSVGDAIIDGYSVGTNSLFVSVKAENAAGSLAGLEQSDPYGVRTKPLPLQAADETVTLHVDVQSPDWAEYDQIAVFVNGATVRHTDDQGLPVEPPRYNLCPPALTAELDEGDFVRDSIVAASVGGTDYKRFESSVDFNITNPGQDYWVVVLVHGRDGISKPLWPVVPNDFADGDGDLNNRSASDIGTVSMAVTNPIFVDADGDGQWTPPGVQINAGCDGSGGLLGLPVPLP